MENTSVRSPTSATRLLIAILLLLSSSIPGHARRERSIVVGTIACHTCRSSPKIGATIALECRGDRTNLNLKMNVKTNEHGQFIIRLPVDLGDRIDHMKTCSLKLVHTMMPFNAITSSPSLTLRYLGKKRQIRIYSEGIVTFNQMHGSLTVANALGSTKFPFPANPFQPPSFFPPNPFAPPPSIFPPNPFQPPPPSIFPPNPFQPSPPPPFFSFPPIPSLTPPSPPPPSFHFPPFPFPSFDPPSPPPPPPPPTFHLPPFPFVPSPPGPGNPPAASSESMVHLGT